jgi:site-specific DNA recombinase
VKVAVYTRVSTIEQDITVQNKMCQEYCLRTGHEIYKIYSDNGISGAGNSRPAFDELLYDMRHYKFNCVMVTKLDRIGRSLQHILSLFDEFNKKGVHFIATTQNIDTASSIGKFQLQMLGAFAEFERNIISERTKDGLKYAQNVGKRGKDNKPRKKRGVFRPPLNVTQKSYN